MTSGVFKSLAGQRFGKLLVVKMSDHRGPKNQIRWLCICDCGETTEPYGYSLRTGHSNSCGCARIGGYTSKRGRIPLTQERLHSVLKYNADTGVFTWRVKPSGTANIGDIAGLPHATGYRVIGVDGKTYRAARLAWLYVHGEFPPVFIDHKNGNPGDDRIENLRTASKAENARNARAKSKRKGHLKGAFHDPESGRWFSAIRRDYRSYYLGIFNTQEEAHAAYVKAAKEMHGEFARC